MRGLLILAISLWAAGAIAEEPSRRQEPRAAMLEALEAQATLPARLPQLPDAASPGDERARREAAEKAARGEALTKMAAMAAHEIRNPLGVIRGTVTLVPEQRQGSTFEVRLPVSPQVR